MKSPDALSEEVEGLRLPLQKLPALFLEKLLFIDVLMYVLMCNIMF